MELYVVTRPDFGWDCVVAVYAVSEVTKEEVLEAHPEPDYVVSELRLSTRGDVLNTIAENKENED